MSAVQVAALVLVTLAGTVVVLVGEPLRQALALGVYGLSLTFLFFTFQAPDVALSEIVVSGVGMPLIIIAALRKIGAQSARHEEEEKQ